MRARDIIRDIRARPGILAITVTIPFWGGFGHFLESTPWFIRGEFLNNGNDSLFGRIKDRGFGPGQVRIYSNHLILTCLTSHNAYLGSQIIYQLKLRPFQGRWLAELTVAGFLAEMRDREGKNCFGTLDQIEADVKVVSAPGC